MKFKRICLIIDAGENFCWNKSVVVSTYVPAAWCFALMSSSVDKSSKVVLFGCIQLDICISIKKNEGKDFSYSQNQYPILN